MIGSIGLPVNPRRAAAYLCLLGYAFIAQMSVTMTAMAESPEAASNNPNVESIVTLGLDGTSWDKLLIWALGLAALVAGAVVVTTAGSIITHKREAAAAELSLARYKETVAEKVAEARTAGIDAGKAAGNALVQAAEANARAADALLKQEELRQLNLGLQEAVSPRWLEQVRTAESLKPFAGIAFKVASPTDFEPRRAAGQIRFMLARAGWINAPFDPPGRYPFSDGITIHGDTAGGGDDRRFIIKAVEVLVQTLNKSGISAILGYPMRIGPNKVVVVVGAKPLPESMNEASRKRAGSSDSEMIYGNILEEPAPVTSAAPQ